MTNGGSTWTLPIVRGSSGPHARKGLALGWIVVLSSALGCEPRLDVGRWDCAFGADGNEQPFEQPVALPWDAGFEDGFCDYDDVNGFCYSDPRASIELVTSPVRSGRFAAAFHLVASEEGDGNQARCVRRGELPRAAYYGAWFFVESAPESVSNWNLMHFQGAQVSELETLHGLWDVSLERSESGEIRAYVLDHLNGGKVQNPDIAPIPIGEWFHLELYLDRAATPTGHVRLYQDGELIGERSDVVTDDSTWGQWYVGNLGLTLSPAESTIYVDDVSVRSRR